MKLYKSLLILVLLRGTMAYAHNDTIGKRQFSEKTVHSFTIQYNNVIRPKGHFDYHCDPSLGWAPLISYGNEFSLGYQFTTKSGFGGSAELMSGIFGFRFLDKTFSEAFPETFSEIIMNDPDMGIGYFNPMNVKYVGLKLKATYMQTLTDYLFANYNIGLSFPFYLRRYFLHIDYEDLFITPISVLYFSNSSCHRKWVPDLTFGVDFLWHRKRNPRSNFIVGVNVNLGFVTRYKGYFSLEAPFDQYDCDVAYGSTFVGFNFGYSFVGLPKTFDRKQHRKSIEPTAFDFTKPIHAVSLQWNNGIAIGGKIIDREGPITPKIDNTYTPELSLKYSCTFAKGFGFSIGIPFGFFFRKGHVTLEGVVPADTVWANGAVGWHDSDNAILALNSFSGFSIQASYLKPIHDNMLMQCELGLSVKPFVSRAQDIEDEFGQFITYPDGSIYFSEYYIDCIYNPTDYTTGIQFGLSRLYCHQEGYWIPNLSGSVNFLVHGKNPSHNFVFGLSFNVDFTKRMSFVYGTIQSFPAKYQSSGRMLLNMTTVGLNIGYQFMAGKKHTVR